MGVENSMILEAASVAVPKWQNIMNRTSRDCAEALALHHALVEENRQLKD
ncbi:hypothetical protein [Streptomyces sp. NPDC060022]